ncbi:hypothetical protein Nhal_1465 [Nitrosococcus halophilus Nc 4]|uniref:Uncharacterized protein n=1 Tax=Nitrosococcus halophilus (strain Nc4) TaxID=472759 RepID=D5C159_NITHN|nr:hypothetical protein [Nitrosococcus halophilus]ADE14616.1 hypothetical protein Nhal_1465 [Nitrosococcus halophilus Nc 4]
METTTSTKIKPQVHDLSTFKQIMESRSHPLDMLREGISNMMAPEIGASELRIQHYSHPEYNASFILKDNGIGMSYTGNAENPGRLDRFIGLAFSRAAGLSADYWGWKGLGSKLMLNCNKLVVETWTGNPDEKFIILNIINPRSSLLSEPPIAPDYYLTQRDSLPSDHKGTKIEVLGYDGGKKMYSMEEIERYLYWNTALGITKDISHKPQIFLKVNSEEKNLDIGFKYITTQLLDDGSRDWRTVVIENPISKSEKVIIDGKEREIKVTLKGGFTLDTGKFGLSPYRYNTGLRLSVKGIPYFQFPFYEYKGKKFQQYKDLCSFVVECDEIEPKLNLDRSNISNQMGDDPIVKTFKKLTSKCFDEFTEVDQYKEFEKNKRKEDERNKASAVRKRQAALSKANQEYACVETDEGTKVIHRVPDNSEMHTLCIFWKLEALGRLPFENFITWEHTKKDGIDVIASFQIDDESSLENFVPVEFEATFENFINHGHNPKQTKCIICWEIGNKSALRKISDFLYYYDIDGTSIPVYEIKSFPDVKIHNYSEIS